jgi:hypothetical protein
MRTWTALAGLLLAGCAHLAAPRGPLTVSDDGQRAEAGGESWTPPESAAFYQRGEVLHVVSTAPGHPWDVAVPVGPDGKLAWPPDGPLRAADGRLHLRAAKATPAVEELIASAQLHPHDDHYHLTHRFQDPDWQALYRLREEGSPLPPIRRQIAATILALLLDERLPGSTPGATDEALRRMVSIIGKARRAVEGDVGARAIELIVDHDFEIRDDGRTVEVEGKAWRAVDPIRFSYCAGHFHVGDAAGKWAQPIEFDGGPNGTFAWPTSIFFEALADGSVAERSATARWRKLIDDGQIRFTRDHWHVAESYANPRLQFLLRTIEDAKVAEPLRDKARALALDVMRLRLDVGSEAEFAARLDAIDQAIDRAGAELEKELKAAPPTRRPEPRRGSTGR